jgi:hypothetical protein
VAATEFQRMLINILSRQDMSVANLAERTSYNLLLLENLIADKSHQISVDFFVRVADALSLTTAENDALARSWTFGPEKRTWYLSSAS